MRFLKQILRAFNDFWQTNVWILESTEKSSQCSCSLIFTGSEVQKNYISKLVFDSTNKETFLGSYKFWSLYLFIKKTKSKYQMVFIEGHFIHKLFFMSKKDFFIPLWLKGDVKIPIAPTNRSTKEDARRIRKNKLSYKIASTIEEYNLFYYSMYKPTIDIRYESTKIPMEYDKMIDEITHHGGKLLLVKKDDDYIAGVVIATKESIPRLWSGGMLNGDSKYWKMGAYAAIYLFPSQYLSDNGYKNMNIGFSRSFLSDGVLQYKKKWGAKFNSPGKRGYILKINSYSEFVKSFLVNNPFAHIKNAHLEGAIFVDNVKDVSQYISKSKTTFNFKSFKECIIYKFKDNNSDILEVESFLNK